MPVSVPRLALLAGVLLACDGDGTVTPPEPAPEPARFELSSDRAADFAVALEDLQDRVLPHLGQPGPVADLEAAIVDLSDALRTRMVDHLTRALRDGDDSVAGLEAGAEAAAIAADLESVRLVLDEASQLLETPSAAQ